jgi:hypothetical protein
VVLEDTPEDDNTGPTAVHVERKVSSCFAAAVYVQRINMTATMFTQNKPPRPPHTKEHWQGTKGQPAPSEEPATYPHAAHIPVPIDIKHALSGKYVVAWRNAIRPELASLQSKGSFRMETLALGRNTIGNKWVFKVKAKPDGSVDRFKARLAAHGFKQRREGVDHSETFSPVIKLSTMRTILAIAAKRNKHMHSKDIETTFLSPDLQDEIYMRQLREAKDGAPRVVRLLMSIYGLK